MRLAIIADDFTGALDAGVQFAPYQTTIGIVMAQSMSLHALAQAAEDILVVNAETRHMTPGEAYKTVWQLVRTLREAQVPYLYLKTDSGLRGNIGASLQAALDASEDEFLAFVPAFPDMHRPTRKGIQYNGETPIHQTPFGNDPFEPVTSSNVADLFTGCNAQLRLYSPQEQDHTAVGVPVIGIFDAESNEDLEAIGCHLQASHQLSVTAGCAAFAAVLAKHLALPKREAFMPVPEKALLVLCGSLNPITRKQLEQAMANGFRCMTLTRKQLEAHDLQSGAGKQLVQEILALLDGKTHVILETDDMDAATLHKLRNASAESRQETGEAVASFMGKLLGCLLEEGCDKHYLPMIIGGDTLMGVVEHLPSPNIRLERELEVGVVMFSVCYSGRRVWMLSKSGGFGDEHLLSRMASTAYAKEEA